LSPLSSPTSAFEQWESLQREIAGRIRDARELPPQRLFIGKRVDLLNEPEQIAVEEQRQVCCEAQTRTPAGS
jgi:hypothetical protein